MREGDADLTETVVNELNKQLREKEARIARLEGAINRFIMQHTAPAVEDDKAIYISSIVSELRMGLEESPQQSLAHIQANAVDKFGVELCIAHGVDDLHLVVAEYAKQLREKSR